MAEVSFDGPDWPLGDEWPASLLPPPSMTVELAALEINALIRCHDELRAVAARDHHQEAEAFYKARATYLRHRLSTIAPARLKAERKGTRNGFG